MLKPSLRSSFVVVAAVSVLLAPSVESQQPQTPDSLTADSTHRTKEQKAQTLDEVRIGARRVKSAYGPDYTRTATKMSALPRDVPQSLTTVTRALAKDQAMRGMADVVRYLPGIAMGQGEGNRDQPTIRGNSSTADFFVDGARDDAQYFRDLYNVERVEALKGSNAMVFGRGGGGGILNRVTKEANGTTARELSLEGGSFG